MTIFRVITTSPASLLPQVACSWEKLAVDRVSVTCGGRLWQIDMTVKSWSLQTHLLVCSISRSSQPL